MKKKILAIVMSLTIVIAFMPTLTFAADRAPAEPQQGPPPAVEDAGGINGLFIDYLQEVDLSQFETLAEVMGEVSKFLLFLSKDDDTALNQFLQDNGSRLDELLQELAEQLGISDWPEESKNKISDAFFDAVEAIKAKDSKTAQIKIDEALEEINKVGKADLEKKLDEFIEEAKAWGLEQGLTEESINALIEQSKELAEILEVFAYIEPAEDIQGLIDQAKAIFEENKGEILLAAAGLAGEVIEMINNGEFDTILQPILDKIGMTREELMEKAEDIAVYALSGESFIKVMDELDDLKTVYNALEKKIKDFDKKWNNAKKLKKKKVAIKKPTNKKKKITVKWKRLKNVTVTGYQVWYKVGKKAAKTKTIKKAKTTKTVLKNLKKGKKVKVKVRAYYKMTYKKMTLTFYSKWSKVKTIKKAK